MTLSPEQKTTEMNPRPRIGFAICSRVIGGHEFQASTIAKDLSLHADVTVFVNQPDQHALFDHVGINVVLLRDELLQPGVLPFQLWFGWSHRESLRRQLRGFQQVIVSAGTVEAAVSVGLALRGIVPINLYLPVFYDRRPVWGAFLGCAYNGLLILACKLFDRVITINRIQGHLIVRFTGIKAMVVPNSVRHVAAPCARPGKMVFIGRLDHHKRVEELLHWIDFKENPFQEILIVGDGPLRESINVVAREMKFVRVNFQGWLSPHSQDALLSKHDVLLLNSLFEGEPLVIREAAKRGMRVICRSIIGVRGVTRVAQRYSTCSELRLILSRTQLQTNIQPIADDHQAEKRSRAIDALLKEFHIKVYE